MFALSFVGMFENGLWPVSVTVEVEFVVGTLAYGSLARLLPIDKSRGRLRTQSV